MATCMMHSSNLVQYFLGCFGKRAWSLALIVGFTRKLERLRDILYNLVSMCVL